MGFLANSTEASGPGHLQQRQGTGPLTWSHMVSPVYIAQMVLCICHEPGKATSVAKRLVLSVLWAPCYMATTGYLFMYLFVIQRGQDKVSSFRKDRFFIWNACMACAELSNANMWWGFIFESFVKPFVGFTRSQKSVRFYWSIIKSILVFILFLLKVHLANFSPFSTLSGGKYILIQSLKKTVFNFSAILLL